MPSRSARLDLVAAALERAAAKGGVLLKRSDIPYGVKFTLTQGAATGVISVYTSGKVVANPKAEENFADVLAALDPVAAARKDAPALSSPPNPSEPSTRPSTNHLNPTGTSTS